MSGAIEVQRPSFNFFVEPFDCTNGDEHGFFGVTLLGHDDALVLRHVGDDEPPQVLIDTPEYWTEKFDLDVFEVTPDQCEVFDGALHHGEPDRRGRRTVEGDLTLDCVIEGLIEDEPESITVEGTVAFGACGRTAPRP